MKIEKGNIKIEMNKIEDSKYCKVIIKNNYREEAIVIDRSDAFDIYENITNDEKTNNNKLNKQIQAFYNAECLNKQEINKIEEILNFTMEDEELGIYHDFNQYKFQNTIHDSLVWILEKYCNCNLQQLSSEERVKVVVHSYIKEWLSGRYDVNEFNSKEY